MIWIDVTEVKNWKGHHTGIQRVITKLGEQLASNSEEYKLCYFDHSTNTVRKSEYSFSEEFIYSDTERSKVARLTNNAEVLASRIIARTPERAKIHLKKIRKAMSIRNVTDMPVNFQEGDILFIPGAFWVYPFVHLKNLKERHGIKVAGVMYDLVPVVVPQFTPQVTITGYGANFSAAIETFDYWFSISENTKRDMLNEAAQLGFELNEKDITVIKLGVDIDNQEKSITKPKGTEQLSDGFALFVSTIEPRKNQLLVYQSVKLLQQQGKNHLPIVLVGKNGWLSDDLVYILQNDPSIAKSIIWLNRVDDAGLRWLYSNCAFTIYPSYYEGWGLPIAESLAKGKACIASNTSSMPEVAGDTIEYFSPYSSEQLAELLMKYSDPEYLKSRIPVIKKYQIPTWTECADQVKSVFAHS